MWCRYPDEIEADFEHFYPRLSIGDWHRGDRDEHGCLKLSSRLFLNLVYRLPEKSEFKTYAAEPFGRNGNWPELTEMIAELHNETAANRASKYAGTEHEYQYKVFLNPVERRRRLEDALAEEAFQESEFDKLLGMFD